MIAHLASASAASASSASSASSADELTTGIVSLFWIACVVALSPLVVRAARGLIPDVVVLLVLGCAIGASGLDLASTDGGVQLIRELGLGLLFLIAGSEVDPATLRSAQGRHAAVTWVLCLLVGFGVAWIAIPDATFQVALVLAIAITSTALGAILPILQDLGLGATKLGRAVLTHGAMGELGPILVMAVLLGSRSTVATLAVLLLFVVIAVVVTVVPRALVLRLPGLRGALVHGMHGTGQTGMRAIFLLLLALMAAAAVFELDVVLGAFAAGFILRELQPADAHFLDERLQIVAWSFPVPVFFVTSGMSIDIDAVIEQPGLVAAFVTMIVVVRGGVVWLRERYGDTGSGLTTRSERYQLALYSAAGLPIIVAVTELARSRDLMPEDVAATLVAAGALTLLLFPLLARFGGQRRERLAAGQV